MNRSIYRQAFAAACSFIFSVNFVAAEQPDIVLKSGLGIDRISGRGRSTVRVDPIESMMVNGTWRTPTAGEFLKNPRGSESTWQSVETGEDGWFTGTTARGGYIYVQHVSESEKNVILSASGHRMVYVNGTPRTGDIYNYGIIETPIKLKSGTNEFLFATGRGKLRASIKTPAAPQFLLKKDSTLPDLVTGDSSRMWGAVVVANTTDEIVDRLELVADIGGKRLTSRLPKLLPMSLRKVGFEMAPSRSVKGEKVPLTVSLRRRSGRESLVDQKHYDLNVRKTDQTRKITFVSQIDGSVQYYAVNPLSDASAGNGSRPAMFLSLHGAGVEAIGQANAYGSKSWGITVAPTNRRKFGFDWEEWGRMDTLEVLELAKQRFNPDSKAIYLTGHSMGGHGTWNVAANFPDQFAAIGPSAGWISFWSYAGSSRSETPDAIEQMLLRGMANADTIGLSTNLAQLGVYVLHGDADDNVPVSQARSMREQLSTFHRDVDWHEQPGAGHWWNNSDEPGASCVDWPPMFDYFARHRLADEEEVRTIHFTTMNPGVSATDKWVTIAQQQQSMKPSSVEIQRDPAKQRFIGSTENVARLGLKFSNKTERSEVIVQLDGQSFTNQLPENADRLWLEKSDGDWATGDAPSTVEKGPHRAGPFKEAFQHNMVFVYGTHGTEAENQWSFYKARFDAEQFWYRGNGSIEILADHEFTPGDFRDRSVILYGHEELNSAWNELLPDSPIRVNREGISCGDKQFRADNLACLFVRPRADSDRACVAVVSGTGMIGARLTDRLPYFTSGTGYPDCLVLSSETLETGTAGIQAAGFFGNDWSVESGNFAFRD